MKYVCELVDVKNFEAFLWLCGYSMEVCELASSSKIDDLSDDVLYALNKFIELNK